MHPGFHRVVVSVGCAGACLVACGTRSPGTGESVAQSTSAITHGSDDAGDPAVVAILDPSGGTACSGTVIAPYIVLTAAHCTVPAIVQGGSVVLGASVTKPVATIRIADAVADPMFDPGTLANDIGLLVLASAAAATPVPLGASAPTLSSQVQLVGWGLTAADAGDLGQKRQGTSIVSAVDATTFDVASSPSQPCDGDSGGPALDHGRRDHVGRRGDQPRRLRVRPGRDLHAGGRLRCILPAADHGDVRAG